MKRIIFCSVIFLCLSSTYALAGKDVRKTLEGFQLFTNCETIFILVEGLSSEASRIGLTKESIQNAIESRLRSAHLYSEKMLKTYLYVNVNVVGRAVSISLEFNKLVVDPFTDTARQATTWNHGFAGTHGNSAGSILSSVSQLMDQFLTEFLRVNDEACRKKK